MATSTKDYRPSDDEPFMNDRQREFFRAKLLAWKDEILEESRGHHCDAAARYGERSRYCRSRDKRN
jgi:hypothetical protein